MYVTTAELNTFLGTSGEDTLIAQLNSFAQAHLNALLQSEGLEQTNHTEKYDFAGR